jgi:NAD(P)-dependent dehydrogenase (short-subunit alcohol dehydrogenase family)
MKVVLADVHPGDLERSVELLRGEGVKDVIGVPTDVSSGDSIRELARRTLDAYGAVHVVCNNAGVNPQDESLWTNPESDWDWALGVNLWANIHSIRTFIPIMLAQSDEGHMVNTASAAGLGARVGMGSYAVTKAAVVQLTEVLYLELQRANASVSASVLCPGRIRGGGTKNRRPERFVGPGDEAVVERDRRLYDEALARLAKQNAEDYIPPDDVAGLVFDAIREQRFWIFTHPDAVAERVQARTAAIIDGKAPALASSIF